MYYTSPKHTGLFFVETTAFTRRIQALGLENELRQLQIELDSHPESGRTEAGTGGLRKVRMPDGQRQKGKRSGARVHYLHLAAHDVIYLVFVYGKDEQDALTAKQRKQLAAIAHRIREEWNHTTHRGGALDV